MDCLSRKLHFLLPLPQLRYIIPRLSMASRLAPQGYSVNFVKAEKSPSFVATLNGEKHDLAEIDASSWPIDRENSLFNVLKHSSLPEERHGMVEKMVQHPLVLLGCQCHEAVTHPGYYADLASQRVVQQGHFQSGQPDLASQRGWCNRDIFSWVNQEVDNWCHQCVKMLSNDA
ncbi:hypothetical protein GOP47_0011172 [Adiantum capillus-veneris]|uniref:Uncharacterized protein n=1 Tax=Adiantum capillus-veneris TaxID=13818 RepID=A0A9D4US96_ADICA|nr:hypothetical protein GOP47_0011172 [Adiantum capillus-veneris]